MEKEKALALLKLDPDATPEAIAARLKQVVAFLSQGSDTSSVLQALLLQASTLINEAHDALPHAAAANASQSPDNADKPPDTPPPIKVTENLKQVIIPNAGSPPGEPFSDQWWHVYKRPVLIGLTLIALGLYYLPDLHLDWPQPEPKPSPTPEPSPNPTPNPIPEPSPLPAPLPNPQPNPTPWPPKPDPSLIPEPNPNPPVVDPTQDPTRFLFGVFYALKNGKSASLDVKQPESLSVSLALLAKRDNCPDYFFQMPADAMTVQSRSPGMATIRVKEKYFTGRQTINDYELVSDNGVWKISRVQEVGPDLTLDSGDPLSFIQHHIVISSHSTSRPSCTEWDSHFNHDGEESNSPHPTDLAAVQSQVITWK